MALISILFGGKRKVRIGPGAASTPTPLGVISLDATLSETHTKSANVTDHPVEDGSDITDHIRSLPDEVSIEGVVSNTPIVFLATALSEPAVSGGTGQPNRAAEAYNRLREIMDEGEIVDVITTLREYTSMAMTSFGVTRDTLSGQVMNASMTFREIRKAVTETVEAPVPVKTSNAPAKDQGKKGTSAATSNVAKKAEENTSALRSLF